MDYGFTMGRLEKWIGHLAIDPAHPAPAPSRRAADCLALWGDTAARPPSFGMPARLFVAGHLSRASLELIGSFSANMCVWHVLGKMFRHFESHFEAFKYGLLRPSWSLLGRSWRPLGASLGALGGVWGPLGRLLGRLGGVLGPLGRLLGHLGGDQK